MRKVTRSSPKNVNARTTHVRPIRSAPWRSALTALLLVFSTGIRANPTISRNPRRASVLADLLVEVRVERGPHDEAVDVLAMRRDFDLFEHDDKGRGLLVLALQLLIERRALLRIALADRG